MKSRTVRVLMVAIALVALAAAGYFTWRLELDVRADRAAMATTDALARQAMQALAAIDAAQRGYVAEGQSSDKWQAQVTTMVKAASLKLTELRLAARTPEAQAALETAIETIAAYGQADAKARDFVGSGQRLSASDVIFAEGHDLLNKAIAGVEDARAREVAREEASIARAWEAQLFHVAGAIGLTLLLMIALVPIPRGSTESAATDDASSEPRGAGLGLSQAASKTAAGKAAEPGGVGASDRWGELEMTGLDGAQRLGKAAEICAALARVRDPKELPALLERAAGVLNAAGVIVWMAEGSPASLRPVLAHGYGPTALARMGMIAPNADNATATAYRTQAVQTMPVDPPSGGALVVPLMTAEGCTGAMAVELNQDIEPSDYLRSVATILAAQLATLITPAPRG